MNPISDIRPSPIAGTWYPGNPDKLAQTVDSFLKTAKVESLKGEVLGLISPHAGHVYSGSTAAYAFKTVQGKSFELIAILSPMHQYHFAPILTTAHSAYETPLGKIAVDREAVDRMNVLLQKNDLSITPVAYDKEHSLEIELPFLQRALHGEFKLLPIMLRSQDALTVREIGTALAEVLRDKKALLVASTDLSHFFPVEEAEILDREMLHQIELFSPEGVLRAEETGTGSACGAAAVAAVLWATKALGGTHVQILHHSTSADSTGDRSSVVGYGAAVILKQ
jgi:AmmeMemoRadiSam system protein B